jgi:hypothetical protein
VLLVGPLSFQVYSHLALLTPHFLAAVAIGQFHRMILQACFSTQVGSHSSLWSMTGPQSDDVPPHMAIHFYIEGWIGTTLDWYVTIWVDLWSGISRFHIRVNVFGKPNFCENE